MEESRAGRPAGPVTRALRRWTLPVLAAALLLAASQLLWAWQTWPVRHLLELGGAAP
jgi:hypothetical protein